METLDVSLKTLCFGGSFNPVHHGHLVTARAAAEVLGFNRVLLIPSGQPPHKPYHTDLAASHHRLAMCRLAVVGSDLFEVSDLEIARPGPSYTLLTVRELQQKGYAKSYSLDVRPTVRDTTFPSKSRTIVDKLAWLIGADMLNSLPKWHEPGALLNEVRFVILARPGYVFDWSGLGPDYQPLRSDVVQAPLLDISSTDIRARVRSGKPIDYLTPPAVVDYIRECGLYR